MVVIGSAAPTPTAVREHLRRAGMRWTPQRRLIVEVIEATNGHVTGSELVDRCRALDPETTPSTVYRTLRVLEDLGVVQHAHGRDGREEFHIRPAETHGHLHCSICGDSWEISPADAASAVRELRDRLGFEVDLSHLSVGGRCATCVAQGSQRSQAT
jgi:Fur family transcriptional regulator, ferric uptake regulator